MIHQIAVGSYTEKAGHVPDAGGAGISILEIDDESMAVRTLSVTGTTSPSYLAFEHKNRFLYAVSESSCESVKSNAWHLDENGCLTALHQQTGETLNDCHLSLSPDNKQLFTASYFSGRMASYELVDGRIGSRLQSINYKGSGPNFRRQEAAHAHQVMTDAAGKFLYVCDLGSDTVWKHLIGEPGFKPAAALEVPPGYGPRHLAFDQRNDIAYILCELVPRILVVSVDPVSGNMKILRELDSTLPELMNQAAPAAIKLHPSGMSLAVSNRIDDTISVFTIDRGDDVNLRLADNFLCRGKTPRDINFSEDGSILYIANQDSHDIQWRLFDGKTGLPNEGWGPKIDIGSPACVINI